MSYNPTSNYREYSYFSRQDRGASGLPFQNQKRKFVCRGIQLRPGDLLDEAKYQILLNVRSFTEGVIQPRPGLSLIADVDGVATDHIHSIKRLNDDINARYTRFIGAGTKLYADNATHDAFTEIASGFSGNPLSTIPHRPSQSPLPFLYFMDSLKSGKAKSTAAGDTTKFYNMGVVPPLQPATVSLAARALKVIDDFEAVGAWANGGTAGAISLLAGKRVDTTIASILYDTGISGWACCNPTALTAQFQPLMRLLVNSGGGAQETVLVEDVFPAIANTTISSIKYSSGVAGLCTIQLTSPSLLLQRDSMVSLAAAENVRVLSVTQGADGLTSFTCVTTATRSAGDAVAGLASFRAYFSNTHAATETLRDEAFQSTVTVGTGYLSLVGALDLSQISNRPVSDEDYLVIHARVDNPSLVTEYRAQLDVDGATNDFTRNVLYGVWTANDFTAAAQATTPTLTIQQRAIQRDQIRQSEIIAARESSRTLEFGVDGGLGDVVPPALPDDNPSGQLGLGDSQWSVLKIKVKDLQRVGTDTSRGLKDVAAIRVALITTGTVVLNVDSWFIQGTYGVEGDVNYIYRYRGGETGARSNPSPPMRSSIPVGRASVVCTPTISSDAQVTKIDWYRYDNILDGWFLVGTQPNSGTFTDVYSRDEIINNPLAEFNCYQPFPIPDLPRSGTCDVVGTEVTRVLGDSFNTSWARGSIIKINGVPCTLYTSPSTTSRLSLNENVGTLSGATFELSEATILGEPRAVMFGPYGGGESGIFFFSIDRGALLWTNPDNPDAASDRNRLEITNPSEPLVNGFIWDGRPYVMSSERIFAVYPNFGGATDFIAQGIASTLGLFASWALCVGEGDLCYFLARDGIYEFGGGRPHSITDDLYPLFPHGGQVGTTINGIVPPDFTQTYHLLNFSDGFLYYDFLDVSGNYRTLVFDARLKAWFYDSYTPAASTHYSETGQSVRGVVIGSSTGLLYSQSGTGDAGQNISCQVRTASENASDPRLIKTFGDFALDVDTANTNLSVTPGFDNYSTTLTPQTVSNTTRTLTPLDLNSGVGQTALNFCLNIAWASQGTPKLYEWVFDYFAEAENSLKRATEWDTCGFLEAKFFQGVRIECDTFGQTRTVEVRYINESGVETVGATLSVHHQGRAVRDYSFPTPFYAYSVRLIPTDNLSWRLRNWKWDFQPAPELGTTWRTPPSSFGSGGYFHVSEIWLPHMATSNLTLKIIYDGAVTPASGYTVEHNNGNYAKTRVKLEAVKCRFVEFEVSSTVRARVFQQDLEVRMKAWDGEKSETIKPFGGLSITSGAEI